MTFTQVCAGKRDCAAKGKRSFQFKVCKTLVLSLDDCVSHCKAGKMSRQRSVAKSEDCNKLLVFKA